MKTLDDRIESYRKMNAAARKNAVVCFGSTYLADMNISEFVTDSALGVPVYSRSFDGLHIADAEHAATAVCELNPSKLVVNIGDEDVRSRNFDVEEFCANYEWLLLELHRNCPGCKLYVMSIVSDKPNAVKANAALEKLAKNTGCRFINVPVPEGGSDSALRVFNAVRPYLRPFPVTFADAMQYPAV